MIYKIIQYAYKQFMLPLIDFIIVFIPRYVSMVLFLALADRLKLKNLRFDIPLNLNNNNSYKYLNLTAIPNDRSVIPYIAHKQMWEIVEPRLTSSSISNETYEIIDAGANLGLFSLQLLALLKDVGKIKQITCVHLIEPDPRLLAALKNNCEQFLSENINFNIVAKAVGAKNGRATFYIDEGNNTNNSLRPEAMEISSGNAMEIEVDVVSGEALLKILELEKHSRIIYKSDLQGSDTEVIFSLPGSFWEQVDILIFEIWPRIYKTSPLDIERLMKIISQFNYIANINDTGQVEILSEKLLRQYLCTTSKYKFFNIFCSRSAPVKKNDISLTIRP